MAIFTFEIGEVAGLNNRVLKVRDLSDTETETAKLNDVVYISAEARHKKILEEAHSAVMNSIKEK